MRHALTAAVAALCLTLPATASAQMMDGDASLAGVRGLYQTVRGYLVATAEQASQELYDYRPTDEVRSFGEILGHVANSGYMFCAGATGMQAPRMADAEKLGSKAEITEALKASFAYCDDAYDMDSGVDDAVTFFGQQHTRLSVLAFNMGHDFEHYGNLVTYMRLNGMVPPSSQGGGM
jgi:uncharacterized damage-inducible protein DinB